MTTVLEGLDWVVLAIYFIALILVAVWVALQKNKNTEDYLNCGKMMARCWLLITKKKAYIQPFGSLVTNPNAYLA